LIPTEFASTCENAMLEAAMIKRIIVIRCFVIIFLLKRIFLCCGLVDNSTVQ
jgi:hypothetical protein